MGGAPPHKNNLIGRSPVGVLKSVCLKLTTTFGTLSLNPRSSMCSLADDPEASVTLDTRLNIGLRKLAKRIQDIVKAVTPKSQQTNSAFHLNTEQRPPIARESFPVTSCSSNSSIWDFHENTKEPRGTKQEIRPAEWTQVTKQSLYSYWNWWIDLYADT